MGKFQIKIDLLGKKFGRLAVLKEYGKTPSGNITWLCQCDCGNKHIASGPSLNLGHTKSCGCFLKEMASKRRTKHGFSMPSSPYYRLYTVWRGIINRCTSPKHNKYIYYGGKGIQICPEWRNDVRQFVKWAESNGWKEGLEIDRIDSNGNYEPSNCRFISKSQNIRRSKTTKLKASQVITIRKLYEIENYSIKKLMNLFDVSRNCIRSIIHNETWKKTPVTF